MRQLDDIYCEACHNFALAWQNWRGSAIAPHRASVRIDDIQRELPYVSVVEVISEDMCKFRIAGTALCEAVGIELTGKNYYDFTTPEARQLRVVRTKQIAGLPCGCHFVFPILYRSGEIIPTEVLSLPVLPDNPDAAPQIFTIAMPMKQTHLMDPHDTPLKMPEAEGFHFIDVGAGVPDDHLKLFERPAATLLPCAEMP
ncbi:MAG: PAS domain-containing protein [Alphaproteobacteria bacterium]